MKHPHEPEIVEVIPDKISLWAFYYCSMTEESSYVIESYHRTEEGATKAMEAHKAQAKKEFDEMWAEDNEDGYIKFGAFQDWAVEPFELIIEE